MKRYNQIYLLIVLLGGASYIDASSAAVNAIRVLRTIATNAPAPSIKPSTVPSSTGNLPADVVPPTAPAQPLSPVVVSQTAGLANFGTKTPITLQYQVQQLPVTAQIDTLTMVALFGSTDSASFTFDAETFAALNKNLAAGHAIVVQAGTTDVDGNIVAYAGLFNEADMSKMFGYAIQEAPAGVTQDGLTGFTVEYQFTGSTTANTINLAANQSLMIFNPTVSVASPLSGVSVQAVFGSSDKPVVSAEIEFDAPTNQAIQAALQAGSIVTFSVVTEYMYGYGDIIVTAYDATKGTEIGNEASLEITAAQEQAGNFIAYVTNLSMTGQAGQASYVRGINQSLQLQVPATANTSFDFYVPADLGVSIPEGQAFPNVTINGIFSDGSSSAGFVFNPQDLQTVSQAIAQGDNVSVVVQQSSNGTALIASVYDITRFGQQALATATNTVTPAQAKETLTGYALTYQLSGQAKPTVLHAKIGQLVTFGTSVYFTLAVDPTTITQSNQLDTRGFIVMQGGNSGITRGLHFAPADFTKIQAALTAGHPVVIGTGYSAEDQTMVMQAYDNEAKAVIAQVQQASVHAAQYPLFGFIVDYMPGPNAQGQQTSQPAKILVPGGNVLTLVPVTITAPAQTAILGSSISCPIQGVPFQAIQVQPNFGSSTPSEWISFSQRDVRRIAEVAGNNNNDAAIFTATYQNNYFVLSVWDLQGQRPLATPIAIPTTGGTYSGFSIAYNYQKDTSFAPADIVAAQAGQSISLIAVNTPNPEGPMAAQSLTLPSAATPVTQLWFSPVFKSGNYAELALQGAPQLMNAINAALAQNQTVTFVHQVLPTRYSKTVQGYDLVCSAWNMTNNQNPVQLFGFVFPLINGTNQQPILQNDQWTSTNMTYQFGSGPVVVLGGFTPQNPTLSITPPVGSVDSVLSAFETAGLPISNVFFNYQQGSVFSAINFNLSGPWTQVSFTDNNGDWGYCFGENPWNGRTDVAPGGVSADVSALIASITPQQWLSGISFMLVGLDANSNVISDITKTFPASLSLYVFDSTGALVPGAPLSVDLANVNPLSPQAAQASPPAPTVFNSLMMSVGVSGAIPANNATLGHAYPMMVTLSTSQSSGLQNTLQKLEGQYPGITAMYSGKASTDYLFEQTIQTWDAYFSMEGNGGFTGWATFNIESLNGSTSAQWAQGMVVLPILINANGQFINDGTTINANNTATAVFIVASQDGSFMATVASNDNVLSGNSSQVRLDLNGTQIWFEYGQPLVLQVTGNPPFTA